ncbi:MAG: archaellin/type IV pilin N-terminal domain-containing protein [Fervidicoccaceae archaeon]
MKERAISPIIATVILVAVTIALAVGVALWMSGLIGGAGSREQLQIMPDSYMNVSSTGSNAVIYLHIKNAGSIDSKIISVRVDTTNIAGTYALGTTTTSLPITVKAGSDIYLTITPSGNFPPGKSYKITVYTDAGGSYFIELTPTVVS